MGLWVRSAPYRTRNEYTKVSDSLKPRIEGGVEDEEGDDEEDLSMVVEAGEDQGAGKPLPTVPFYL